MFGRFFGAASRRSRLLKLLDQERELLLNGPLAELGPVVTRRAKVMAEMEAAPGEQPKDFLLVLRGRAERNQALLTASLAGVRAARAQLEGIAATAGDLGTYTTDGAPAPKPAVRVTRDQRA